VIRAVATRAIQGYGWRVLGIRNGTMGLLRSPREFEVLDVRISTVNINEGLAAEPFEGRSA
jgi:6-phosphofructokinase